MKYQLWSTDEYNQNSILTTVADLETAIQEATKKLYDENADNPLTSEEKLLHWSAFLPVVVDEDGSISTSIVYAGRNTKGQYIFNIIDENEYDQVEFDNIKENYDVRFYLGESDSKEHWYAYNPALKNNKNYFNDITGEEARDKTILSINIID